MQQTNSVTDDLRKRKLPFEPTIPLKKTVPLSNKSRVSSNGSTPDASRKTSAPLKKSADNATRLRHDAPVANPERRTRTNSRLVSNGDLPSDFFDFDELAEVEARTPAIRRRSASKPAQSLPKWLTTAMIVRVILGSVALGIIWGSAGHVSSLLSEIRKSVSDVRETSPLNQPVSPLVTNAPIGNAPKNGPLPLPANEPAKVTIQTQVKGASVLVDGELQGTTPLHDPLTLKPGPHRLEVVFGKSRLEENLQVTSAQTRTWPIKDFSPGQIAEACKRSVCLLRTPEGHGSGFLVQDQHTIVTAAHVVDDVRSLDDLEFVFSPSSDKRYPNEDELKMRGAQLIHFDRQVDVAILRLKEAVPADRQPLMLSETKVELQTHVIAVGNPGYGKGRFLPLDTSSGMVTNNNPLMINAEVKGGYSGGPVFGARTGEVVGITSAKLVSNGVARGDNFTRAFLSHVFLVHKALQAWNVLTSEEQTAQAETVFQQFTQEVSDRRLFKAGMYLATTSEFYYQISMKSAELYGDFFKRYGKVGGNAANDALEELRRKSRKDFNPDLEEMTERYLKTVLKDELIDSDMRQKLEKIHPEFEALKKDATKLEGHYQVFQKRIQKTKENIDIVLRPLLKGLAEKL